MTSMLKSAIDDAQHWPVCYRKGQVIYDEGEPATAIYRVRTGCVRLQIISEDGQRQIIAFLFPGDLFGVCLETRQSAAETVSDAVLDYFPTQGVVNLSRTSTAVFIELMNCAAAHFGELAAHASNIAHMPAEERVLWFLHRMSTIAPPSRTGDGISWMPMAHRDIADFLGLTAETLSRSIKHLEERGLLQRQGRTGFRIIHPPYRVVRPEHGQERLTA
jgi:CRP-like cAMP-binding protein